jgi:hydrogenase maturation protease
VGDRVTEIRHVLVYGYGNPGRQDDGLGPLIAADVERLEYPFVDTDANYQLQIEDADAIARYKLVLFVDASMDGEEPFTVRRLAPSSNITFTSHVLGPESILAICRELYGSVPVSWLIGIRGYVFELREGLTEKAEKNFKQALAFIQQLIGEYEGSVMAGKTNEQKTILIIDDDADLRASMRIVLEASGFSVGEAADGEEGFKIAERIKPDAVIVDLMMETIDAGSKVSTQLKEKGFNGLIYLLSAAGDTVRYNIDAQELGLAGIFQKPVDHKVLINTLKKQLRME